MADRCYLPYMAGCLVVFENKNKCVCVSKIDNTMSAPEQHENEYERKLHAIEHAQEEAEKSLDESVNELMNTPVEQIVARVEASQTYAAIIAMNLGTRLAKFREEAFRLMDDCEESDNTLSGSLPVVSEILQSILNAARGHTRKSLSVLLNIPDPKITEYLTRVYGSMGIKLTPMRDTFLEGCGVKWFAVEFVEPTPSNTTHDSPMYTVAD